MTAAPAPRAKDVVAWAVIRTTGEVLMRSVNSTQFEIHCWHGFNPLHGDRIARVRITEIQQEATRDAR